ncbi:MAG: glycoside hydrolase family 15 protein, partial [Chloroflexia bacterium]|nr:glycoside hydrolase family 15 protein [Chloroflexia bacterium]
MTEPLPFIPYPPIERHGVIGDRRTAALVAADGTIDWLCLPDYDGPSIFGTLLDAGRGGFWRLGPVDPTLGAQRYVGESAALQTVWETEDFVLVLTDVMLAPEDERMAGAEGRRTIVRHVHCTRGAVSCLSHVQPRRDFVSAVTVRSAPGGIVFEADEIHLSLWSSHPLLAGDDSVSTTVQLQPGEAVWAVLSLGELPDAWTEARARGALAETIHYWEDWNRHLSYTGPRSDRMRRTAQTVHLLGYAPAGSLVAAPTTSLPERIGGDRNYDYRFAWVRDASLSLAILSLLGDREAARRYMDWLSELSSSTDSPLQVVYRVTGGTDLTQQERGDLAGYRESLPVRIGNHAFDQRQLDSLGYLADCALIYLKQGGAWRDAYWHMIRAAADYTVANWRLPDSGIWELPGEQHYVSSKVMSWVTLQRAIEIAKRTGHAAEIDGWLTTMDAIHAEVMARGWSDRLKAFTQRYEADTMDAAALLIPVMGFLPADHPRVIATVEQIVASLTIDGLVHRFIAAETPRHEDLPLGEFEGAFLPCTFWLATTYAMMGRPDEAQAILERVEP